MEAVGSPSEVRSRVSALRGQRPGPLDDGATASPSFLSTSLSSSFPGFSLELTKALIAKQDLAQLIATDRFFWRHVDMSGGPDACWPYVGARTKQGYGIVTRGKTSTSANRYAFLKAGGVLKDGEVADHFKCDNPPCCNPTHLRATSQQVNILRGTSPSARHAAQTHCKNGHPFDLLNTGRSSQGRRVCLECRHVEATR